MTEGAAYCSPSDEHRRRIVNRLSFVGMAVAGLLVAGTFATSPAQAAGTAQVSVVHGIPNTPVNVFVNDKLTLPDFKPGTVAGPLSLLGGSYTVTVFPAADTAGAGTPVIKATATIQAGHSYSLVAHLTTAGKPALTAFVNDTSAMPAGMGRLIVRHVAAAPTVDVRANGKVAFPGLTNPHEAKANLPAGSISADVVLAGTSTVVLGPANVTVAEGQDTIGYAIGSAAGKTLAVVVQTISGLSSPPAGVPTGTGGLAATSHARLPVAVWLVSIAGLLLATLGATSAIRLTRAARSDAVSAS
jgi:hypothetical protein